jgi:predicted aspartyl protease
VKSLLLALALACGLAGYAAAQFMHHASLPLIVHPDGLRTVDITLGGATVRCVVDSGASLVSIPQTRFWVAEAVSAIQARQTGTVTLGLADGSEVQAPRYIVNGIRLVTSDGSLGVPGLDVALSPEAGNCLIGQSLLSRFGSVSFDYQHSRLDVTW